MSSEFRGANYLIEKISMNKRVLHTMLRTGDLDRSINFYTNVLGMKLLRQI